MAANAEVIRSLDREIQFTVFPNAFASSKVDRSLPWSKLVQNLSEPKTLRASKAECQLLKLATFGDVRTTKNSLRHDANMRQVTGLVGDYDGEVVSVEEAGARLRKHGIEAFFYTSASHTPEKPRWRVLAPLSAPAETTQHYALMAVLNGALGGILSTESFTASQTYYFGRVENAAYETLHVAGALCVDDLSVEKVGPTKRERAAGKHEADDLTGALLYDSVTDETLSDLRSALAHLASCGWVDNGNRVKWIKIGQNLAGLGDVGEDLFVEVSDLGDAPDPEDVTRERFATFQGDRSDYRSIFAAAQEEGWANPKSVKKDELPPRPKSDAKFVQASAFSLAQKVEWHIKYIIQKKGLVIIYGDPGSSKSFFAFDMVAHIARGLPWRGHRVKQSKVAYIAAEGVTGFGNRMAAYARHHDIDLADLPVFVRGGAMDLKREFIEIAEQVIETGAQVVVIDTLAAVTPGANENTSEDMGSAIDAAQRIIEITGATVILIHHTNKMGDIRGWSGVGAAVDNKIRIERKDDLRTAHIEKQKEGKDGQAFGYKLAIVHLYDDEDGDPVTSCAIEECAEEAPNTRGVKKARKSTAGDFETSDKLGKARMYLQIIEDLAGLDGANIDESDVVCAIQGSEIVNPLKEPDHPRADSIKRTLLTLADKGKIKREGRWIRVCR